MLADSLVVPTFFGGHALLVVNAVPIPAAPPPRIVNMPS